MFGVDFTEKFKIELAAKGINLQVKNIEQDELDFSDESVDVFLANQVLEHIKEIFWLNDQVAKKLKVGGYFIIGLPNISSFHNRILFLGGKQPTQMKTNSAHIRGFSHQEIIHFFNNVFPGGYKLIAKKGAQFYPFPKIISRWLCFLFPSLAFSNFYLFEKIKKYNGEFLAYPTAAELETNFKV
jgi:SAM-dependent methyltransferase